MSRAALVAVIFAVTVNVSFRLGRWWEAMERECVLEDPMPTNLPFPPPRMIGVYAPNTALHNISRIGDGLLHKAEDLAFDSDSGFLYAACGDGWISRFPIINAHGHGHVDVDVQKWKNVGGRPLGIAFGPHGELLVCEPFQGLLNVTEDSVQLLTNEAQGVRINFADGVDVARDGQVYFTDASVKYGYGFDEDDIMEGRPYGRLLQYDPHSESTTVLLTQLFFPNGVALSPDQSFLVFCETAKVRCTKYWLKGKKKGKAEIFIDNLPGFPDNIRLGDDGLFWIGIVSKRSALMELMLRFRVVKKMVSSSKKLRQKLSGAAMERARVIAVNLDGVAVKMYEDPDASAISFVTVGLRVADSLYLGGFGANFTGRLRLG